MYKPAGVTVAEMRMKQGRMPRKAIYQSQRQAPGDPEIQHVFNRQLKDDIRSNKPEKVKETIVNIMQETLSEPRSGSLEGVKTTINVLVSRLHPGDGCHQKFIVCIGQGLYHGPALHQRHGTDPELCILRQLFPAPKKGSSASVPCFTMWAKLKSISSCSQPPGN